MEDSELRVELHRIVTLWDNQQAGYPAIFLYIYSTIVPVPVHNEPIGIFHYHDVSDLCLSQLHIRPPYTVTGWT